MLLNWCLGLGKGKVEITGKPVSIDEVISHIEEALND